MDRVANGITRTNSDSRNTGNEDNHIGDIIVENGTHKNAAERGPKKPASSYQTKTAAFLQMITDMPNKVLKMC